MPRPRLLGFECGETSLLLRYGIAQSVARPLLSGRLGSGYAPLLDVVLHERVSAPPEGPRVAAQGRGTAGGLVNASGSSDWIVNKNHMLMITLSFSKSTAHSGGRIGR
jgi:hypothetical protein